MNPWWGRPSEDLYKAISKRWLSLCLWMSCCLLLVTEIVLYSDKQLCRQYYSSELLWAAEKKLLVGNKNLWNKKQRSVDTIFFLPNNYFDSWNLCEEFYTFNLVCSYESVTWFIPTLGGLFICFLEFWLAFAMFTPVAFVNLLSSCLVFYLISISTCSLSMVTFCKSVPKAFSLVVVEKTWKRSGKFQVLK